MGFPKHIHRQAKEILAQRRQSAEYQARCNKEALYDAFPELWEIEQKLADCGRSLIAVIAARSGEARAMVEQLKLRSLSLQQRRSHIFHELGIDEQFLQPQYHCPHCQDSGYVDLRRCSCMEQLLRQLASQELGRTDLENFTFDNFHLDYYSEFPDENGIIPRQQMAEHKRYCVNYAQTFDPRTSGNLLFCGGTGLGKTHLSMAIAGKVIEGGHGVIYASMPNLMSRLEEEHFNRGYGSDEEPKQRYLSMVLDCDLLILDDLGTEFQSQFMVSTLYNLINSRLLQNKPTIISTNLIPAEISKRYSDRMVSRLFGSYRSLTFMGRDIRIQKGLLGAR